MRLRPHRCRLELGLVLCCLLPAVAAADDGVDFTRDVKPLLSNKCFACHGPDDNKREAGLRLDTVDGALADLGGYAAVTPGSADESTVIERVTEADPDLRMPPAEFGEALTAAEVDILKRWIKGGAKFEAHWAYVKPERPDVDGDGSAIDQLVRERLPEVGLKPSPQADPHLLARRVALDLTGLPPTIEQADKFAANPTDEAYAALVDQLLASPHYGEHWASMWLDVARYADSAGYADDPLRTIWAYRDYVIRAFNENRPFDDFTIEQLAGDMLPNPTEEQLIATAFHRNTLTNNEGGTDDEEFRNVAIVDRVNTTGSAWLGTTFACCQCHNHKYDPISQTEYFQVFAIFNQSEDTDKKDERPTIPLFSDEQLEKQQTLKAQLAALKDERKGAETGLRDRLAKWEAELGDLASDAVGGRFVRVEIPEKQAMLSLAEVEVFSGEKNIAREGKAKQSSTDYAGPAEYANDGNTDGVYENKSVTHTRNEKSPWWEVDLGSEQSIDAVKIWNRMGGGLPERIKGYRVQILNAKRDIVWEQTETGVPNPSEQFATTRFSSEVREALAISPAERTDAQWKAIESRYRIDDAVLAKLDKREKSLTAQLKKAEQPTTTVPVMRELADDKLRQTHIHIRGNYQSLGDEVRAATPSFLQPLEDGAEADRLTFAKWLVSRDNPLTSRVLTNRIWARLFGRGIVNTVEDFGAQGDLPTHPQLLDWLSVELMDTGWDLKHLIRTIVLSKTYRQSAEVSDKDRELDKANEWLARGPRFRITAEMVRDQALATSGLLSEKMYGPPVHPPQPKTGLKAAFGSTLEWNNSTGEDRYRRAVYTEIRRSLPYPDMQIMDAPNREVCINERSRTNTPLQAFLTLNGEAYVEATQSLARLVVNDTSQQNDAERLTFAFRKNLIRPPKEAELTRLQQLLDESREFYKAHPDEAKPAATEPLGDVPTETDIIDLAAWTSVCSVIMNLDEVFLRP